MRARAILAALLAAAGLSPASAAPEAGSRPTREFVAAAASSDAYEIVAAQAALAQSSDRDVQAFAQQMIRDHGGTAQALQQAAAASGLRPPPLAVGADQAPLLAALQGLRGPDFDRAYWRQQALAHRSALTVQQLYAETGDAPALRRAAAAAVPLIQSHLAMAERMSAAAGGP